MLKTMITLFLLGMTLLLSACATKTGPAEAYKGETPKQIYQAGEQDMQKGDYSEAIKRFEALDVQYPLERETEFAEVQLVYAYYRKEEYPMAVAAADRFTRLHPLSQYTDYVYFIEGLSEYYQNQGVLDRVFAVDLAKRDLVPMKKAYNNFSAIVDRFPNSRYAPAAYQYQIYLRNLLAKHQLQLAEFYYDRKAYVAVINRANGVIKHYQGSPSVPKALVLMAKAYRALHLKQEEKDTLTLIEYNYPHSSYVREALEN
jgi:outer membrane protein assembly factor BamD